LPNKRLYLRALDVFATHPGLGFEDAPPVAIVGRTPPAELYSYDRDFDGVPGITRIEPAHQ
jgi:hypothetical protein